MNIQLQKTTGHLPEGNYEGVIKEANVSADLKYLWLKIDVENTSEQTLNISMPINSVIFDKFARCFVGNENSVNTDDFINTLIEFNLRDRPAFTGETYSKFVKISPIYEEN